MSKVQSTAQTDTRPVQLQVNTNGAWKTVVAFDAGNDLAAEEVQRAVELLFRADQTTQWRIATPARSPIVLRMLSRATYGIWMTAEQEAV